MKKLILIIALGFASGLSFAQSVDERVEAILSQLTLDEKLQMMVHQNPAIERLGLKPYSWWNEALHGVARNGYATVYPMPIAMAATFDPDMVRYAFEAVGIEAHRKFVENQRDSAYGDNTGLTFFCPNINIFRDPRWGRGMETFGEDPYLTALMGEAVVNGLQGTDTNRLNAAACVKHLAVHSGPEGIRHEFDAQVSMRDLWTTYLPAFEYIIKNTRVQQVMCGYNRLNGQPCCTNEDLLVDILRNKWHYDNLIVTDCWALNDCWEPDTVIPRHRTHATAALTAQAAFGSEVDLECGSGLPALRTALDSGYIAESKIDEHVRRILRTRLLVGVDYPEVQTTYPIPNEYGYIEIPYGDGDVALTKLPNAEEQAFRLAQHSLVLLKNQNGLLPLVRPQSYALLGPNAADSAVCLGNYNGTPRRVSTLYTAMKELDRPFFFDTACHLVDRNYTLSEEAWREIEKRDVIIFVGGLSPTLEGEELQVELPGFHRGDRTQIELPAVQVELLKELKRRTGKPIVLVLYCGGAIALEEVEPYVDAIVVGWYGGQAIGKALADNLFTPSLIWGNLPVTFYKSTAQLPPFEDYSMQGRTYRYLTEEPLYPFGFGLRYEGPAQYESLKIRPETIEYEENGKTMTSKYVVVEGELKWRCGWHAIQVYITNLDDPQGPRKSLAGVHTTDSYLTIILDPDLFRVYDNEAQELVPPKKGTRFLIQVGTSSADRDLQSFEMVW